MGEFTLLGAAWHRRRTGRSSHKHRLDTMQAPEFHWSGRPEPPSSSCIDCSAVIESLPCRYCAVRRRLGSTDLLYATHCGDCRAPLTLAHGVCGACFWTQPSWGCPHCERVNHVDYGSCLSCGWALGYRLRDAQRDMVAVARRRRQAREDWIRRRVCDDATEFTEDDEVAGWPPRTPPLIIDQ